MPFLIVCFTLFFGLAQLYPVVAGLDLSLPSWIVAGLLLAIASNYDKLIGDNRIGKKPGENKLAGQGQEQPSAQSPSQAKTKTVEPSSAAAPKTSEAIATPSGPSSSASGQAAVSPSVPASKPMDKPVDKTAGKPRLDLPTRPSANAPAKPSISFTIPKRKSS